MPLLLLLGWTFSAAPAASGTPADAAQARAELAHARQLYLNLQLPEAIALTQRAVYTLEVALPETQELEPLAQALALLAACELEAGHRQEANAAWLRLLRYRANYEPDPAATTPRVRRSFTQAAAQGAKLARWTLRIESEPAGAQVRVDGLGRGSAPLEVRDLPEGDHALRLDLPGHRSWWGSVSVHDGVTDLRLTLEEAHPLRSLVIVQPAPPPPTAPTMDATPAPAEPSPVAAPAAAVERPSPAVEPALRSRPPTWLWITGAVVTVVGGSLLGIALAQASGDRVSAATAGSLPTLHTLSYAQAQQADDLGYAGEAGLMVGGAILLGSGAWALFGPR